MTDERLSILPLSVEWWTPATLAACLGKSDDTVRRRFNELVARGVLVRYPGNLIWSRSDAQKIADFIAAHGPLEKSCGESAAYVR